MCGVNILPLVGLVKVKTSSGLTSGKDRGDLGESAIPYPELQLPPQQPAVWLRLYSQSGENSHKGYREGEKDTARTLMVNSDLLLVLGLSEENGLSCVACSQQSLSFDA